MKHEIIARYPAPSDVVIRMFCDKDFHTRKLEALGLPKYKVLEHEGDAENFRIRIERKVPMDAPGMVRKVIPMETTVVSEERWNRKSRSGQVKVEPQGVPVEMSCTATMKDEGAGCAVTYVWDVRSRLPLVGGALEKFICADMDRKSAEEARAAATLLPAYR